MIVGGGVCRIVIVHELTRSPVKTCRHGPTTRHQQSLTADGKITLRAVVFQIHDGDFSRICVSHSTACSLSLLTFDRGDGLAGFFVQRIKERSFEWPHSHREIALSISQDGTATDGPDRDQSLVTQYFAATRRGLMLPNKIACLSIQTIKIAVVCPEIDSAPRCHRCKTYRTFGKKPPAFLSGSDVDRRHTVVARRTKEHRLPHDDRFVIRIEIQSRVLRPSRLQRRILAPPLQMKLVRQLF